MYSVRPSWLKPPPGGLDLDMYLSTDDEGDDGHPSHQRTVRDEENDAAELARAKRAARRQMERVEIMEIERAFAALDNIRVDDTRLRKSKRAKSKPWLDPSNNRYIDNEAVEAGQSDSDLSVDSDSTTSRSDGTMEGLKSKQWPGNLGDELSADSGSTTSRSDGTMKGLENLEVHTQLSDNVGMDDRSNSEPDDFPTLYDNYCASRQLLEAQIQKERKLTARYDSSSSISSECSDQHCDSLNSDNENDTDTEVEASFSSVHG